MLFAEGLVAGRSVALVGNSQAILRQKAGRQIDCHDVVIRINLGIPTALRASVQDTDELKMIADAIGRRTSIWASAKYWPSVVVPSDLQSCCWMKLTAMGKEQLPSFLASMGKIPVDIWPQRFEDECREFVGADPGTGIRMLWWLKTKAQPRSVSCFGMDCWEEPTHWSGRRNTPNHKPDLERAAMLRLL